MKPVAGLDSVSVIELDTDLGREVPAGSPRLPLTAAALRLLSDERLARLAAKGDRVAFAVIFDRYHQELYGYCASLLRNAEDAADAVQSTMLSALRALDGERRHIALRPWLYRIAHNESITMLRRPRVDPPSEHEDIALTDVEADAAVRAHLRTLLDDIRELPERQRGALVMREMSGLEYSDIAAALETTPAGAKQAVYDARRALHELARGRESDCEGIRRKLSDGDRRFVRARAIRAHLSACAGCRSFQAEMAARESALAAFTPAMPAAVAAGALQGALTGGAGGAGVATLTGAGSTAVAQAVTAAVVAVALGAGAVGMNRLHDEDKPASRPATGVLAEATPDPPSGTASAGQKRSGARIGGGRSSARDRSERARERARAARARERARDAKARRAASARGRDDEAARVSSGADSASLEEVPGASSPYSGHGGNGIKSWVRPGRSGGGGSGDSGPIRTGVGNAQTTVNTTVDQVRDALPVQTPQVPKPGSLVPRPKRR